MKVAYRGTETVVPDGAVAVIGADPEATIRVARPGISRRHAVLSHEGDHWFLEDTTSRNGTYRDGTRIRRIEITGPTVVRLGHPTEGELLRLSPVAADTPTPRAVEPTRVAPRPRPAPQAARPAATPAPPPSPVVAATGRDPRLEELVIALREQVRTVRSLTFSVWAMIAVTAVLALLTLFVGIVGR